MSPTVESTNAVPTAEAAPRFPAIHEWTNGGGEVLVLRYCTHGGESGYGFRYPLEVGATATCPDWDPKQECGNGLHGWPWGLFMGSGKGPVWSALWQVYGVQPENVVDLGGKVKFSTGVLRFSGRWEKATEFVLGGQVAWVACASSGAASSTGDYGAASSTGECSVAVVTGVGGTARCGPGGCIALAWQDPATGKLEIRCASVAVDGIKPGVAYRLSESGIFTEVA